MTAPSKKAEKAKKDMHETLRYKHMVARLKGLSPYKKTAALMQEIAKGSQWRIDAAIEAVKPKEWPEIDTHSLFKQAAIFGRLQTIEMLSDKLGFAKGVTTAPPSLQAAFNVAALQGNYKTADALAARGAKAGLYALDTAPTAAITAVRESDIRKINYLIKHGENPGALLHTAASLNNLKVTRHLVEKHNADVNFIPAGSTETPAKAAVNKDVKAYLAQRGGLESLPQPLQMPVEQPVIQPVSIPAITDEMVKGTKYETKLVAPHVTVQSAWDIPELPKGLKEALRDVKQADGGLDFTLSNGHKLEWRKETAVAKEFVGRATDGADFDDTDAKATVAAAIGRGWKAMNAHGNKQQQEAMWLEAQRQGIVVANFKPDEGSKVLAVWAKEEAARKKPSPPAPAPK